MKTGQDIVIAVDLGATNIRAAIINTQGDILHRHEMSTTAENDAAAVIKQIIHLYELLNKEAKKQKIVPSALGLGIPGFLVGGEAKVVFSPNLPCLQNVGMGSELRRQLPIPLALENDGNCHALGEWWLGAAKGFHHVVSLTLGTGVGGGIIIKDQLLRGSRGAGGEFGHMVIDPNGIPCGCGGRGCLETVASAKALERITGKSAQTICLEARNGRREALEALEDMGRSLGIAITSLGFIFDPELIVIGGKASPVFPFISVAINDEMQARLKHHPANAVKIVNARYPDDAGLLGAAFLALGLQ